MTAKNLTQEQRTWFVENFDHTKNQELADRLGTSPRSVTRIARELGLCKTKEFVRELQRNASAHAARANHLTGGNSGAANLLKYGEATRFKSGTAQRDRMSNEAYAAMLVKRGASRKELFKKERRRVLFGLEQQTNLRVVQCPRKKVQVRYDLRKRGYVIARASNKAMVTNETRRSIKMEAMAQEMGIKFYFNNIAI